MQGRGDKAGALTKKRERVVHGAVCTQACGFEKRNHPSKLLFVCLASGLEHECGDACKHATNNGHRVMCSLTHTKLTVTGSKKTESYAVTGFRPQPCARTRDVGTQERKKLKSLCAVGYQGEDKPQGKVGTPQTISPKLEASVKAATPAACDDSEQTRQLKEVLTYMESFLCPRRRQQMNKKAVQTSHEKAERDLRHLIQGTSPVAKGVPPGPPEPVEHDFVFYTMYYMQKFEYYMKTRFVGHAPPPKQRMLDIALMVVYDFNQYTSMQASQAEGRPESSAASGACAGTLRQISLQEFTLGLLMCLKLGVTGDHGVEICPPNPLLDFVPPAQFAGDFRHGGCKMIPLQASISLFLTSCPYARTTF
jgi:hypothetical protein